MISGKDVFSLFYESYWEKCFLIPKSMNKEVEDFRPPGSLLFDKVTSLSREITK